MKKVVFFICFFLISYSSFSQTYGCTDSLAYNYDSSANIDDLFGKYKTQINLQEYAKGIYFLEIYIRNGVVNKKIILQ